MEITLEPQNIEDMYRKGPGTEMPKINTAQIPGQPDQQEQLKSMRAQLPDMREFTEFNRLTVEGDELMIRQMTAMVLLGKVKTSDLPVCPLRDELQIRVNEAGVKSGRIAVSQIQEDGTAMIQVPGLQGIMLQVDDVNARGYLVAAAMEQQQIVDSIKEKAAIEKKAQEEANDNTIH